MWNLGWTKWHWARFPPSTPVSPTNSHSTKWSVLIYHPELVQQANWRQINSTLSVSGITPTILMLLTAGNIKRWGQGCISLHEVYTKFHKSRSTASKVEKGAHTVLQWGIGEAITRTACMYCASWKHQHYFMHWRKHRPHWNPTPPPPPPKGWKVNLKLG
jgi:hypothetical protein